MIIYYLLFIFHINIKAILEEFKEKRGASLMDRHVAKKEQQPKAAVSGRRAFDRELVS